MTEHFAVPARALAVVLPHVSTDLSRRTLRHVCIEPGRIIVATDAVTLGAARWDDAAPVPTAPRAVVMVLIPQAVGATIRRAVKRDDWVDFRLLGDHVGTLTLHGKDVSIEWSSGDSYPNWRQALPPHGSPSVCTPRIALVPALLRRFEVLADRDMAVSLRFVGEYGTVFIQGGDLDAFGLLMPYRRAKSGDQLPKWP